MWDQSGYDELHQSEVSSASCRRKTRSCFYRSMFADSFVGNQCDPDTKCHINLISGDLSRMEILIYEMVKRSLDLNNVFF